MQNESQQRTLKDKEVLDSDIIWHIIQLQNMLLRSFYIVKKYW